jgi:hypothetical protein
MTITKGGWALAPSLLHEGAETELLAQAVRFLPWSAGTINKPFYSNQEVLYGQRCIDKNVKS